MADKITQFTGSPFSILLHTIFFASFLLSPLFGIIDFDTAMLLLTTVVSLEAIYLALLIQMSLNKQKAEIEEISEDVENIEKDIDEIQEDVEEISDDMEEVAKDVEEISDDVEEIHEHVEEISEDVEDLQEDLEKSEKEEEQFESKEEHRKADQKARLEKMENILQTLLSEFSELKKNK
jgi:uncharacterized membrane protein